MVKKKPESQTYEAMMSEVSAIVENLNAEDIDLDQLVEKVERGYDLIKQIRLRLDDTKIKIEKLRTEFEQPDA